MTPSRDDAKFMLRALDLARGGMGATSPNPMVGAVLVKNGRVVGEGFHARAGEAHAEIRAMERAQSNTDGATLYINLEPCAHHGKTPPCAEALVRADVARVVAAMEDPNPAVAGKGFAILRKAGVEVEVGLHEKEARRLNEAFVKFITTGLPFLTLKLGMSLDGKIADKDGRSRWITSEDSRARVHEMRFAADAILVGGATVASDDPLLTVRAGGKEKKILRVILDPRLELKENLRLWDTVPQGDIVIACVENAPKEKASALRARNIHVEEFPKVRNSLDLRAVLVALGKRGITHVLCEGGGRLAAALIQENLADKVVLFIAPVLMGNDGKSAFNFVSGNPEDAPRFQVEGVERIGSDVMVEMYPKREK